MFSEFKYNQRFIKIFITIYIGKVKGLILFFLGKESPLTSFIKSDTHFSSNVRIRCLLLHLEIASCDHLWAAMKTTSGLGILHSTCWMELRILSVRLCSIFKKMWILYSLIFFMYKVDEKISRAKYVQFVHWRIHVINTQWDNSLEGWAKIETSKL